jgi:7,8-dihydropterin-6-yl-methyl-4-(beta-D-ribofuranosyl)aminobenzene 5'-phosphate synthase
VGLRKAHGFSALIEDEGVPPLLFDTGADGPTLLHNMKGCNIDPRNISTIVISHAHDDHTDGLSGILCINEVAELYLPSSFKMAFPERKVTEVKDPIRIRRNVFSIGELEGVEQSLALKTAKGVFVLTGCAHSGVRKILTAAAKFGELYGIAGGFHGFHDFKVLQGLSLICACHCTRYKQEMRDLFGDRALGCGVGTVIEL